jgi:hypothetical protein
MKRRKSKAFTPGGMDSNYFSGQINRNKLATSWFLRQCNPDPGTQATCSRPPSSSERWTKNYCRALVYIVYSAGIALDVCLYLFRFLMV